MRGRTIYYRFIKAVIFILLVILSPNFSQAQKQKAKSEARPGRKKSRRVIYGQASFYANKFHGRKTASGEIFSQDKLTAACNVLPLGTWIKVTNLKNGKSIIVKVNDRLHRKTSRLLDLTRSGAKKLGYIKIGLTRVKIEILDQKKYKKFS